MEFSSSLRKLRVGSSGEQIAQYSLSGVEGELLLNPLLGKQLVLSFDGKILCTRCSKVLKKSFGQGYCFTCFKRIPEADFCNIKPETCHFHKGTCRDPEWGLKHCFMMLTIYLANSSGFKVGITRTQYQETRWLDQGAVQALPILRVEKRLHAGLIEAILREHVSDRTNWRRMLSSDVEPLDLFKKRDELFDILPIENFYQKLFYEHVRAYSYPILSYPKTVKPFNLDKTARVEGTLLGIKGQYLIFDTGVLNIRKFTGYNVHWNVLH